jgi:predicted metalloprotease with PDZ domain
MRFRFFTLSGRLLLLLPLVALSAALPAGPEKQPKKEQPPAPLTLAVDATDAARKVLHARMVIPATPGPLTLVYPKWIPGEHAPTGPIADLAGLKISAGGKDIPWQRDDVDMYAFHVKVPEGANGIEVKLDYLSPALSGGFSSAASATSKLVVLNWNQVLLYPKGKPARDILCRARVRLPAGWKLGTALPITLQEGQETTFDPVSLETLVDSPVLCGLHFREVPLGQVNGKEPPHFLVIAADSEAALELKPEVKANLDRLVAEAVALFGARHYQSYRFLLTLSDHVAHFGLEHHQSSDDRAAERTLLDDHFRKTFWGQLLPHEYVHSWNGKYRRPKDMVTDDFQGAQRTKMLWVYEGLTQYLGVVLTARSGLWTSGQFRDNLAYIANWAQNQRGRTWRSLEDTAVAAQLLYSSRSDWAAWRRGVDFYDEGVLLWLEVDTIIREKSKGKRSLDDFCRRFHGGKSGPAQLKPFTFAELVADLNAVEPHDWKGLLKKRLTATSAQAPLEGIKRGGWKLAYGETPSDFVTASEGIGKTIDLTASVGMVLKTDGTVQDIIPGRAAFRAGVGPGMKLVAVNGKRWTAEGLRAALGATKKKGTKLELLLENGDFFKMYTIDYQDGLRYPKLERTTGEDLLSAIVQPLTPILVADKVPGGK